MGIWILRFFVFSLVSLAANGEAAAERYAFITNARNPAEDLSLTNLTRILKGDRQFWESGKKIVIVLPTEKTRERDVLLEKVYRMKEDEFRTFWLGRVFRGEVTQSPLGLPSLQAILQFVQENEGAVAFVDLDKVPKEASLKGLKVLKIDGKNPKEKNYPIRL